MYQSSVVVDFFKGENMNYLALIAAIIGVTLMSLTVHYGNKIQNRWLRYLAATLGIIVSFVIMSFVPKLFGDNTIQTSNQSGVYLGVLIVTVTIIKSIFFRKKNED
jgi:uncharacterized membrane protein YkgB